MLGLKAFRGRPGIAAIHSISHCPWNVDVQNHPSTFFIPSQKNTS